MKTTLILKLMAVVGMLALAGCARTRSISNSTYNAGAGYCHQPRTTGDYRYRGELSEFDVLGIEMGNDVTDAEIARTLDGATGVSLRKGSAVLLVQSGAIQPDQPMVAALEKQFVVVPFSGQPDGKSATGYSRCLRLAAAQAACETVICYWGALESASKGNEVKTVSWVPLAGWVLPDESQQMRIHLKVAVVDVRSGCWTMLSSQAFENRGYSSRLNREAADRKQVEKLKQLAYASAAEDLVRRCSP